MNDDIEKILSLADKYALECYLYVLYKTKNEDLKLQARKELQDEIVSLVAQYKEDAEKWRENVELNALRVMYRSKAEDI